MSLNKIRSKIDLSVVKNIELKDMAIDFTGPNHWTFILSSDHMIAKLAHIPGFAWPIQQVQLRIVIQDKGFDIGKLESPYTQASVSSGIITSSIPRSALSVFPSSHTAFSEFFTALATQPHHTFTIKGSTDIIFSLGLLGTHSITGVDFVSDLTLRGLNNLPEIQCKCLKDVAWAVAKKGAGGTPTETGVASEPGAGSQRTHELVIQALFDIQNSSQLSLTLGDVTLSVLSSVNTPLARTGTTAAITRTTMDQDLQQGENDTAAEPQELSTTRESSAPHHRHQIGTIMFEDLTLLQGMNDGRIGTIRLDANLNSTKQFLKNVALEPQTVHLKGFHETSKNKALAAGLTSLTTSFVMPTFKMEY
ncbi:hypothetical protein EDD11_004733 [Mortierella claussenii]|nr:hypothetical protein EDD11_004733 [Mortierella claussenii]